MLQLAEDWLPPAPPEPPPEPPPPSLPPLPPLPQPTPVTASMDTTANLTKMGNTRLVMSGIPSQAMKQTSAPRCDAFSVRLSHPCAAIAPAPQADQNAESLGVSSSTAERVPRA